MIWRVMNVGSSDIRNTVPKIAQLAANLPNGITA